MNLPEREQLTTFLQQLAQAHAGAKDEEAQAMIRLSIAPGNGFVAQVSQAPDKIRSRADRQ